MSKTPKKIALAVNEKGMMKAIRDTFSSQANVLSELLQNGRRAGATQIHVTYREQDRFLEVRDNGSGIGDFSKLLEIATSGWDAKTIDSESAFGIGFASAIFGCDRLEIESNGQRLCADTGDILAFKPVEVLPAAASAGTRISLFGVKRKWDATDVRRMVRGFAVPVTFNGESVPRPEADDASFIDCEVGRVRLSAKPSPHYVAFLQGFEICRDTRYAGGSSYSVIHLDPATFRGRVPDRQQLVDHEVAEKKIVAGLNRLWKDWFAERKSLGDEDSLLTYTAMLARVGCMWMLNDVQTLPGGVLSPFSVTDVADSELFGQAEISERTTREQAESLILLLPSALDESSMEDCRANFGERLSALDAAALDSLKLQEAGGEIASVFNAIQYLSHKEAYRVEGSCTLDPGHWLFSLPNVVSALGPVTARMVGKQVPFKASGHCFYDDFMACESIALDGPFGTVDGSTGFVLVKLEGEVTDRLAVTKRSNTRAACAMYSSYTDDDHYQEDWLSEDEGTLDTEIIAALDSNPAVFLTSALRDFRWGSMRQKVQGKSFNVIFNEEGDVEVAEVISQAA